MPVAGGQAGHSAASLARGGIARRKLSVVGRRLEMPAGCRQRRELRLGEAGFVGGAFVDAHAQVEPCRLAGDRIGVRMAAAAGVRRQDWSPMAWLSRKPRSDSGASSFSLQRAAPLADGVPGPDGVAD